MSARDRWLYVNDYPMDRIGLFPDAEGITGSRGTVTVRDEVTNLPGRQGVISLARESETVPRRIVLETIGRGTSAANLQTRLREIRQRFSEGVIEVRFQDDPEKVFYCKLESIDVRGIAPMIPQPNHNLRITLLGQDPIIYDRNATPVAFSNVPGEVPLGTAPSFGIIRISGAVTNPTLTYKDIRGDTIGTFGLTVTLAAGEFREIDMDKSTVLDDAGLNAIDEFSSGDFFAFDPADAAGEDGPYPTVETSPDTDCDALYRKAYL